MNRFQQSLCLNEEKSNLISMYGSLSSGHVVSVHGLKEPMFPSPYKRGVFVFAFTFPSYYMLTGRNLILMQPFLFPSV